MVKTRAKKINTFKDVSVSMFKISRLCNWTISDLLLLVIGQANSNKIFGKTHILDVGTETLYISGNIGVVVTVSWTHGVSEGTFIFSLLLIEDHCRWSSGTSCPHLNNCSEDARIYSWVELYRYKFQNQTMGFPTCISLRQNVTCITVLRFQGFSQFLISKVLAAQFKQFN